MAGLWLAGRWIYAAHFAAYDIQQSRTFGVFLNLFFILALVGIGLFVVKKPAMGGSLANFKHLVRFPLVYTLFVTILMYLYYAHFSNEVQMKRDKDIAEMQILLDNPDELAKLKTENEALKDKSAEEIRELGTSKIYSMTSPKVITSLGFLMLSLSSVTYTILALLISGLLIKR